MQLKIFGEECLRNSPLDHCDKTEIQLRAIKWHPLRNFVIQQDKIPPLHSLRQPANSTFYSGNFSPEKEYLSQKKKKKTRKKKWTIHRWIAKNCNNIQGKRSARNKPSGYLPNAAGPNNAYRCLLTTQKESAIENWHVDTYIGDRAGRVRCRTKPLSETKRRGNKIPRESWSKKRSAFIERTCAFDENKIGDEREKWRGERREEKNSRAATDLGIEFEKKCRQGEARSRVAYFAFRMFSLRHLRPRPLRNAN